MRYAVPHFGRSVNILTNFETMELVSSDPRPTLVYNG